MAAGEPAGDAAAAVAVTSADGAPGTAPLTPADPGLPLGVDDGRGDGPGDASVLDMVVQAWRVAAVVEATALAGVAHLVTTRQRHARDELVAWRRDHPRTAAARRPLADAVADCDELVAAETADELALAVGLSSRAARDRVALATDLLTVTPDTWGALSRGRIDLPRARRITEAVTAVHQHDPGAARVVEAELLSVAADRTPGQISALGRRAALRHCPGIADEASQRAVRERRCGIEHGAPGGRDPAGRDAGQATLWLTGRADRVQAAYDSLTTMARAALSARPDDTRTLDQARADVALSALLRSAGGEPQPSALGAAGDPGTPAATASADPAVTVHLVVPLATLIGRDEPGHLVGHGPVPAPLARHLAEGPDVRFTRWLTDPDGMVTATGSTTYRPSAPVARLVRTRDATCRFPGCARPAESAAGRLDLDHVTPWPHGPTEPGNLAVLCRSHHIRKHSHGWHTRMHPDTAALTWTSPTGYTRTTHPPRWPAGP